MKRIRSGAAAVLLAAAALGACERRADVPPAQPMEGAPEVVPQQPEPGVAPGAGIVPNAPPGGVVVELIDREGRNVGGARLEPEGQAVRVSIRVNGLRPDQEHGVHFHENGQCEPPTFQSAGGHFSPGGRQHGLENPQGPHAGDMPNVRANAQGVADTTFVTDRVTLGSGANSLLKPGGTALVVHAGRDDQRTDPSGDSGDRIACGVIRGS
jgi:superoxide dismutase, Cu-Zn family